ncbi:MAG TPA: ABC transporter permease [Patescibacteria group bacterium]|nr:ABC transporter permease [Patescibacteria group bacterium]
MRAALVIATKDLRQRLRDRTFLVVAVIAPFGLAAIFSTLLGGVNQPLELSYAVADLDRSELSSALRDGPLAGIEDAGIASVAETDSAASAREAVDIGEVDAALIVPEGFGAAVTSGQAAELEIIGSTDAGFSTDILRSIAESFTAELEGVRLAVALTAGELGETSPEMLAALAREAAAAGSPITLTDLGAETLVMPTTTYFAASMAIFFLFFTAQFGVLSLLTERRQGTLPRLVAAPIRPWAIVAGKAIGSFVMGIVAMAVLVAASSLLLGARWGDPVGVAALVLAAVIAAMGITALITTLARTEEQAGGWSSIVAVTLAILGGAFFDLSQAPEILTRVSFITPHAWFLEGLDLLAGASSSVADVLLPVGALLGIGLVTGAVGLVRAGGLVVRR